MAVPTPLPIDQHLPDIVAAVRDSGVLVLSSPPGTGKTTRVPGALVDGGVVGEVVVLEPRRIAARSAARRVASERNGPLGGEVGYTVRHERKVSADTRIRFVTEGVFVRRLLADPFLEGVGAVVLDEFHERHLESDLALAMTREVRETVRPDLAIVVMSATLEVDAVRSFLGDARVVEVATPAFPVRIAYDEARDDAPLERRVARAVRTALTETEGDVLVFLPGVGEIQAAAESLTALAAEVDVLPLHGQLPAAEQDRALMRGERRRVVLATNVAESSVTVAGVTAVVDTGLARVLRHDARRGLDVLRVETISRASAEQRRGRAGRSVPGVCYRLWTSAAERGMAQHDTPEVRRIDLAGAVLQVRAFSSRSPADFGWFEAPAPADLARADRLLELLGARAGKGLSELGRAMVDRPLHPRLARAMLAGTTPRETAGAALLVATLSERDPRPRERQGGDLIELALAIHAVAGESDWRAACRRRGLGVASVREILALRDRLAGGPRRDEPDLEAARRALLAGFPDRVARRHGRDVRTATMVGGRGLELSPAAAETCEELFLALDTMDSGARGHTRTRIAAFVAIERSWLEGVITRDEAELDEVRGRVVNVRRTRYHDLVLDEARGGDPDPVEAERLLGDLLARDPWRHLTDPVALRRFLARAAWWREVAPEAALPPLNDDDIARAAAAACAGRTDLRKVSGDDVLAVLTGQLPTEQVRALERAAPDHVTVPSGRRVPVDYGAPAGPTIAVPIQEVFGWQAAPRVGGSIELVLELLAPNRRPIQVTRDLAGFWTRVYPKARIELGRRYPKHHWPEDPTTAEPRVLRRRRPS